jgi:hypothetical protein
MDMKSFCMYQVEEAKKYKWIQSQRAGRDLGEDAIREWVNKFAAQFRKDYNHQYSTMVDIVADDVHKKLHSNGLRIDKDNLKAIVKHTIDTFTEKWTIEVACNRPEPSLLELV